MTEQERDDKRAQDRAYYRTVTTHRRVMQKPSETQKRRAIRRQQVRDAALPVTKRGRWSEEELAVVERNDLLLVEMACLLGRSRQSVVGKRHSLRHQVGSRVDRRRPYSASDDAFILSHLDMGVSALARALGRSVGSASCRRFKLLAAKEGAA